MTRENKAHELSLGKSCALFVWYNNYNINIGAPGDAIGALELLAD